MLDGCWHANDRTQTPARLTLAPCRRLSSISRVGVCRRSLSGRLRLASDLDPHRFVGRRFATGNRTVDRRQDIRLGEVGGGAALLDLGGYGGSNTDTHPPAVLSGPDTDTHSPHAGAVWVSVGGTGRFVRADPWPASTFSDFLGVGLMAIGLFWCLSR